MAKTTEIARDLVIASNNLQGDSIKWVALTPMVMALFTASESILERR